MMRTAMNDNHYQNDAATLHFPLRNFKQEIFNHRLQHKAESFVGRNILAKSQR
jgi:hypothetical protein